MMIRWLWLGAAAAGLLLTAGCGGAPGGGGGSGPQTVSFQTAEQAGAVVTVEGIPDTASIRKRTGEATEFTIREEASGRRLQVVAPQGVTVPANITSASYVLVTGQYHPEERTFRATQVETKVPNRDQQPRG
jgi:hypothetical protein